MTITTGLRRFPPCLLGLAVALGALVPNARAATFNIGEIEGQFDSALSIGASWSTQSASQDLVGATNGGNSSASANDDGRLNFKQGETFSKLFKGVHDLELKYGDTGVFLRGKYWYDFELKDESRPFKQISDDGREEGAKSSGAELLDAFVYHNYTISNQPGSARLGKQVVSWGESTFIPNSINSINPIDVAAFRRPGSEIKEGLVPVSMAFASQGLTEKLSAEAFYQLDWEPTVLDNCGTFFGSDTAAHGCDNNLTVGTPAAVKALTPYAGLMGVNIVPEGLIVPRGSNHDARDSGQWGLALRWMGDDTEYGAYAMNIHSRLPYQGMTTPSAAAIQRALTLPGGPAGQLSQTSLLGNSHYFLEYPEDVRLYGLSFATTLPSGTAWSGEISYRPNMPLAINAIDVTNAPVIDVITGALTGGRPDALATANTDLSGYKRKEMTQAQTTLTHFFERVLGADRLTLVGEAGITRLGGLESRNKVRYGRITEVGAYSPSNDEGFYTSTSWGYRARGILDYSDVIAGVNLKPNLAWSHDVQGYGPTFNEGSKAVSLGLDADYRSTYTASLSYTNYFGGDYNNQIDRDFLALSLGVNF
ncbi:hypothetical protein PKB_3140 [Pseudomonas knackmussii B13]|uniref:Type V secretory pathway, adhesin AidA n=1 Tax=Pseudomonas knackmussii (strain DSM 6978 / CCUG 54928 / LMG 23759 / B13) TaxID=1301098 RepID=A0A024HJ00_PSEKB|nr:DUF1302 domain-containing protein [Pseudomonas knackmussii]CDF84487.1 hypothetical protein PKB_3140 [Pseudomonas knackmussii B13]